MQVRTRFLTSSRRRGISLLEVVIALGIFVGTYAIISRTIYDGARAGREALAQNEAALRSERMMNEILSGVQAFASSGPNSFEDDSTWSWTAEVSDGPNSNLKRVDVTVTHSEGNQTTWTLTISRYARDPELYLEAAASGSTP